MRSKFFCYFYLVIILFLLKINVLLAQNLELDAQEIFIAQKNTVTASGEVELRYLDHYLQAGNLEYLKIQKEITAQHEVYYQNKVNNINLFADYLVSDDSFSVIEGQNIYGNIALDSNIRAQSIYKDQNKIILNKADFTSCKICKNGKKNKVNWQLSANKITYLKAKQNLYFSHVFFKIYNIPILYLPKFTYPAPEVKKRTGILPIQYSSNSMLKNTLSIPLFINSANNYDFTYTPSFFGENNILHDLEFRYLDEDSELNFLLSMVNENSAIRDDWRDKGVNIDNEDPNKYNVNLSYLANYEYLSVQANIKDVSDKSFLERYKYNFNEYYNSNLNIHHISDKQELIINASNFRDFKNNNKIKELPNIFFGFKKTIFDDVIYNYNIDYVNLDISDNNSQRSRVYYKDNISKDYLYKSISSKISLTNLIRAYYYDNNIEENTYFDYTPQLSLSLAKPYIKLAKNIRYLLSPQLNMSLSPDNNTNKVNNLDSINIYLDSNNLFADNKIVGIDYLEEGYRANYGVNAILQKKNILFEKFIGQSFYEKKPDQINRLSGLKDGFSDIVGKLNLSYKNKLAIRYDYKALEDDLTLYYNQVVANYQLEKTVNLNLSYINYKYNILDDNAKPLKQLSSRFSYNKPNKFQITIANLRNMLDKDVDNNSGTILSSLNLEIYGDCVTYIIDISKNYISNDIVKPSTNIMFGFKIKGLN
jgi:LPS-assembly protein